MQVAISIQSLILVDQPYFNEPGYESEMHTDAGRRHSADYNTVIRQGLTLTWPSWQTCSPTAKLAYLLSIVLTTNSKSFGGIAGC